jgi:hypothetical protein
MIQFTNTNLEAKMKRSPEIAEMEKKDERLHKTKKFDAKSPTLDPKIAQALAAVTVKPALTMSFLYMQPGGKTAIDIIRMNQALNANMPANKPT